MSVVEEASRLSGIWDALRHPRDRRGRWRDVVGRLGGMGINAHLVGGSVRDEMLGREPKDHDFLAAGHDHASIRAAVAPHGRVEDLTVAGRHVGVRLYPHGENFHIEITPPRTEVSTGPGHQDFEIVADPTVSVADDLARRDFTVNAMARNLDTGELVDPHGGQKDLENGVLRTVTPDSFRDDPLRIVRGIRFTSQLGLHPDPQTREQMTQHADGIDHLSGERIGEQMDKLLMGEHPAEALRLARDTGVLHHVYPELAPTFGFGQESKYHGLTADEHTFEVVQSLANAGAPLHVRLAGLFHDSGKPEAAFRGEDGRLHYYGNEQSGHRPHELVGRDKWLAVAKRHHYDSETRDKVAALVEHHMFQSYSQPTDARARRHLRQHGQERALDLIPLKRADLAGKESGADEAVTNAHAKLHEFERRVREQLAAGHAFDRSMLQINGADLKALGYPESPLIGKTLDRLLDSVIGQPDLNRRDWLLSQAQRMLRKVPPKADPGTLRDRREQRRADKRWEGQRRQYRAHVATLGDDALDNERYTVRDEWSFVEDEYRRRYPDLERDDFLALLGLPPDEPGALRKVPDAKRDPGSGAAGATSAVLTDERGPAGGWVFFRFGNDIYRAPAQAPVQPDGVYPMGGRYFDKVSGFEIRRERGIYPFDQRPL